MALTKKQIANRKKLITTLRSGTYKQTKNVLFKNDKNNKGFCCQGVACDIFKDEVGGKWAKAVGYATKNAMMFRITGSPLESEVTWLPEVYEKMLGFNIEDSTQLVRMNDGRPSHPTGNSVYNLAEPCTFDEIADCMEFLTLAGI